MKTTKAPAKKSTAKAKGATATKPRTDVYQAVTDRICAALEGGQIPWRKGWNAEFGMPKNYATGHVYQGINAFLLSLSDVGEYPLFLTFKQALELGGCVRKGEKCQKVIYCSHQEGKAKGEGQEKSEDYFLMKEFAVFNISQIDGIDWVLPTKTEHLFTPNEAAERIAMGYLSKRGAPSLVHGGGLAYYAPGIDAIQMPLRSTFRSTQAYTRTLFHELTHSTGAAHRLNRPDLVNSGGMGSQSYGREELTAEMGAAFLSAEVGYAPEPEGDQHASYIQNWLKAIRGDKKLLISAAAQAQKAAYLIKGETPPAYKSTVPETVAEDLALAA